MGGLRVENENLKNREEMREIYLKGRREELKNKSFTLISNNCDGCFILHDLGLKFNTPTVNLYFSMEDFIKFLERLDYYLTLELEEAEWSKYPIGKLGDIKINFMHYENFQLAKEKWDERKKRIDKNNLYILATEKDGCTYELIKRFNNLPYKNKVMLTHKPYDEVKSTYYIKGFESRHSLGFIFEYKGENTYLKYYDDFDYVEWFNNGVY